MQLTHFNNRNIYTNHVSKSSKVPSTEVNFNIEITIIVFHTIVKIFDDLGVNFVLFRNCQCVLYMSSPSFIIPPFKNITLLIQFLLFHNNILKITYSLKIIFIIVLQIFLKFLINIHNCTTFNMFNNFGCIYMSMYETFALEHNAASIDSLSACQTKNQWLSAV